MRQVESIAEPPSQVFLEDRYVQAVNEEHSVAVACEKKWSDEQERSFWKERLKREATAVAPHVTQRGLEQRLKFLYAHISDKGWQLTFSQKCLLMLMAIRKLPTHRVTINHYHVHIRGDVIVNVNNGTNVGSYIRQSIQ